MEQVINQELLDFIAVSPSVYHVIENFSEMLCENGYIRLSERERWELEPGEKYFVTRGGASLIAFRVPWAENWAGFRLSAAHSDSPTFKLKSNSELCTNGYLRLNTEKYGGMLMSTWFDRSLSVAGRVLIETGGGLQERLVDINRDLLVIPSVAIHMNRNANDGVKLLANIDTVPVMGSTETCGSLNALIAANIGVEENQIVDHDLFLYCRDRGRILGAGGEYLLSPKLDDLECAWGCMRGFVQGENEYSDDLPVCCIFHNEEVGSETRQGAASTFLRDTLRRICLSCGRDEEDFLRLLAGSFMISADNAHAIHPNHPEYSDGNNAPQMNGGIVIKYNANQRYASDGVSAAVFRSICTAAGVPVQVFANRADLAGGSTLGSIADTLLPIATVDIGLAQLAMHSAVETAGSADLGYLIQAVTAYYVGQYSLLPDE